MSYPFDERRSTERKSGHDLYLDHVAEVNGLKLTIAWQADHIDALIRENGRMRDSMNRPSRGGGGSDPDSLGQYDPEKDPPPFAAVRE